MLRYSIGRDLAIDIAKTGFWRKLTALELAFAQMYVAELFCDLSDFQTATEKALDHPVFTHMFGDDDFITEAQKSLAGQYGIDPTSKKDISTQLAKILYSILPSGRRGNFEYHFQILKR